MDVVKFSKRSGNPIKAVPSPTDQHNYYVINSDLTKGVANVHFVDFYSGLAQFSPIDSVGGVEKVGRVDGFFYVRHAADFGVIGDGQGDSTVHKGWAMYIWDPLDYVNRKPVTNAGWVKVAQQGDVDWDISDELKAQFVLKTVFNARVNEVDNRFTIDEGLIKTLNNRLLIIENNWDKGVNVLGKAHTHENMNVLNQLSDSYNLLYYKNKLVSGNSYVYDRIHNGEIIWIDPTLSNQEIVEPVTVCKNSFEVATRFLGTALARVGFSLFVVEVDGSISLYKFDKTTNTQPATGYRFREIDFKVLSLKDPTGSWWDDSNWKTTSAFLGQFNDAAQTINGSSNFCYNMAGEIQEINPKYIIDGKIDYAAMRADMPDKTWLVEHDYDMIYAVPYSEVKGYLYQKFEYREIAPNPDSGDYEFYSEYEKEVEVQGLVPVFAQTVVRGALGLPEFVDTLPTANKWYVDRGVWVPLYFDGTHVQGHLHVCVEKDEGGVLSYYWKDLHQDYSAPTDVIGGTIKLAYSEDYEMWKKNYVFWDDPQDDETKNPPLRWRKSSLVRKIGSAPVDSGDGITVKVSTTRNGHSTDPFVDTIPYTTEPVFYRVFSDTTMGARYAAPDAIEATKLDWPKIMNIIRNGMAELIFEVGSTIVLPDHSTYGQIECEVVAINRKADASEAPGILVVAKNLLCEKILDAVEPAIKNGTANPEALGDGVPPIGSNGELISGTHRLNSLNILVWLNSTASNWFAAQTVWDVAPDGLEDGYLTRNLALEPGFLSGFDPTYTSSSGLNIFKFLGNLSGSGYQLDSCKVALPVWDAFYAGNITVGKQLGRALPCKRWAVLNPGVKPSGITAARPNYGFKTIQSDGAGGVTIESVLPDTKVGIAPMFFIG